MAKARSARPVPPFVIVEIAASSGTKMVATAAVVLKDANGVIRKEASGGDGQVSALFLTINRLTKVHPKVADYQVHLVEDGKGARGMISVKLQLGDRVVSAEVESGDIVQSSAEAYMRAVNELLSIKAKK